MLTNNDSAINEYFKQEIKKKLYKNTNWLSTMMKLKDRRKIKALECIYNEMFIPLVKRNNYKTYGSFAIIFLNFYVVYKRYEENPARSDELTINMSKSHYSEYEYYTNIPDIVRILKDNDYISLNNKPWFDENNETGECSKFIILDKFKEMIVKFIDLCGGIDINIDIEEDVSHVTLRVEEDYIDKKGNNQVRMVNKPYGETSITKKMKKQISAFNEIYKTADIQLDTKRAEKFLNEYNMKKFLQQYEKYHWKCSDTEETVVKKIMNMNIYSTMPDLTMNQTYRVFTDTFKNNGRLHGLWLHNAKRELQDMVLINGNHCIGLDMSACHPNILASLQGIQLHGDFYDIPIHEINIHKSTNVHKCSYVTDMKAIRQYIKFSVLTMINCKDIKQYTDAMNSKGMYKQESVYILELFLNKYQWLSNYLCKGYGLKCMYYEATIMNNVMVKVMLDNNIILLPIYDGLIVDKQYKDYVKNVVEQCWYDYFGTNIIITEK